MLDAYLKKGARLPTEPGEGRRVVEDAITSTLFSPLKFMSPRHAGQILSWFSRPVVKEEVEVRSIELWRRFPVDELSQNHYTIEPDLIVDGYQSGSPFRWIIEVKWDAVLLRTQVEDQVRICAKDIGRWMHISLVKSAELAAFEFPSTSIIQWNEALGILHDVLRSGDAEGPSLLWCRDAIAFLERLGVGTFEGFGRLDLVPVTVDEVGLSLRREFSLDGLIEDLGQTVFALRSDGV